MFIVAGKCLIFSTKLSTSSNDKESLLSWHFVGHNEKKVFAKDFLGLIKKYKLKTLSKYLTHCDDKYDNISKKSM